MRKNELQSNKGKIGCQKYGDIYMLGSRKDVERLYQAMDIFVLPSRYEGLPVVAVEAQAAGLPCILSDKITNEVQISCLTKFKNIEQTPKEWADVALDLTNQAKYKRSAERADEIDRAGFSIKKQGEKMQDYYIKLTKQYNQPK